MTVGALRRAQLIAPFGVGAMSVLVDGTSVVTAGLDYWYSSRLDEASIDIAEYVHRDWRLEARLNVAEFRLPPDYRTGKKGDCNQRLVVPVLRFPRWHFCRFCKTLKLASLTESGKVNCSSLKHRGKGVPMSQVPFVAMCEDGHIQDFPFAEWVHRSGTPRCDGVLRLNVVGSGLEGQYVVCDACGANRSLGGITEASHCDGVMRTRLSDKLSDEVGSFLCAGSRPWLGLLNGTCGLPLRGALRGAGNVYFPKVESSIYIPHKVGGVSAELYECVKKPTVALILKTLQTTKGEDVDAVILRELLGQSIPSATLRTFSDQELLEAYCEGFSSREEGQVADEWNGRLSPDEVWRHPEYLRLREQTDDDNLRVSAPNVHSDISPFIARVRSVDTLRETRALWGFTRVKDRALDLEKGKDLLRRESLGHDESWLPGYVVKGEGIYMELDADRLAAWEAEDDVQRRICRMIELQKDTGAPNESVPRSLSARYVLLHTLSHMLINQLVFFCGYSSASLRERLYVSLDAGREMAGLLIYTASGDSEGTMGGLVSMAQPANLRHIFAEAISGARWCSADPVCMTLGEKGQGPGSCNLAACHGCAMVPETSCEEYNRFLDRGLVIGTLQKPNMGFFSSLV